MLAAASTDDAYLSALKSLRGLAGRIGDDSNLTLDPVLESYHVQNIVVIRLPTALEEIGQAQLLTKARNSATEFVERKARLIALDTLLRANMDAITNDLQIAERGNSGAGLKQTIEPALTTHFSKHKCFS